MQLPDLYSGPSAMKIRVSDLANTWSVLTKTRNRFTVIASALFMLLLIACSAESQEVTPRIRARSIGRGIANDRTCSACRSVTDR